MSDGAAGIPAWLLTAGIGLLTAVGGFYTSVILGRKRLTIEETASLSKSEREFRLDIMANLKEIRAALAECEKERLDCAEREVTTHAEIEKLRDEIRDLKSRLPQRELQLGAAG